jgi:cytochrome c553
MKLRDGLGSSQPRCAAPSRCAVSAAPPFEDSIAQRALACTGCHGPQGARQPDGYYPRIAGKPPIYLYNQLLNFRDGRRRYGLMTGLLTPLDDAYLHEIATHFAGLEVAYPPPQPAKENATVIEQGRLLVMQGRSGASHPGLRAVPRRRDDGRLRRRFPACSACRATISTPNSAPGRTASGAPRRRTA